MYALLLAPAFAADPLPPPVPDALVVMQFSADLGEDKHDFTVFDINRAYFGVRQEVGQKLAARVLFDAGRSTDNTRQWVYVKNAFLEWKNPAPGMKVQAGMIPTPYVGYTERFWGHRFASKAFAEQFALLSSADFGFGAQGTHARGLVDWSAAVINGEGYASPELDGSKAFQGRVSVDPLAAGGKMNLVITGFGSYGTASPDTDQLTDGDQEGKARTQYAAALGYKMDWFLAWAEYDASTQDEVTAAGYSATLMPRIPKILNVYARIDHFDPDGDTEKDAADRLLAGVSHEFTPKMGVALQYDRTTLEATPDEPVHGVFVKAQAGF
jgi:hypothetical protein